MKRAFFVSAAFLALVGSAAAADLPRKMPVKAAPAAPAYDWTGFYVGGYYATGLRQSEASSLYHQGSVDNNKVGWAGGLALGYNYQFAPNWLVGLEGDVGYLSAKRSFQDWVDPTVTVGVKTSWLSTVRARFGYVAGPSLIYATGGAAFVNVEETFGGAAPTVHSSTRTGWAAGGGIETKLSRNWSTTSEYLYVDAGSTTFSAVPYAGTDIVTFKHQVHVLKTGFNYKLDGGPFEMFPFFGKPFASPDRWAGFYAGLNVGGGLSASKFTGGPVTVGEADVNGGGFAGGAHAGYNWIIFTNWVIGVEGDIGYLGLDRSYTEWDTAPLVLSQKTDWYGTLRGRVGTTTGPALLYVTGGGAWARVRDGIAWPGVVSDVTSTTAGGWTFGGGTEIAIDSRWSARFEYLYMDLGKATIYDPTFHYSTEFKNRFQVVRAGLTYQFGGPEVVTARY